MNSAFAKWFQGSRAVDSHGQPLVVYHGSLSPKKFKAFDVSKKLSDYGDVQLGIFFTASEAFARHFAEDEGHVIAAFLRLVAPYEFTGRQFFEILEGPNSWRSKDFKAFKKDLIKRGFDGIVIREDKAIDAQFGPGWGQFDADTFVAFYPEQIKAVDNDGTWDVADPDIRSNPESPVWLDEFLSVGGQLTPDGKNAIVFHGTTKAKAGKALSEGLLRAPLDAPDSYGVYVSSSSNISRDYGDGTVVVLEVPLVDLHPDDAFPGERLDFSIPTRRHVYRPSAMGIL